MEATSEAPSVEVNKGKLAERVEQAVWIREQKRALKSEFEKKNSLLSLTENKIQSSIMLLLNEMGVESARCPAGTVFKTTRTTASLADPDAFMKYVIANAKFELIDRKANTTAVKDYLAEHKALPPGVNLSSIVNIGVHKKVGAGADTPAQTNGASTNE